MLVTEGIRSEAESIISKGYLYTVNDVDGIINRSVVHQEGALFLCDDCVVFMSSPVEDYSLIIDYSAIGVHAICRSPDIYKSACIYCQISDPNGIIEDFSPAYGLESDRIEEDTSSSEIVYSERKSIEEVLFSPTDITQVEPLFEQFSSLQMKTSCDDDEEDEDFFQADGEIAFDCDVDHLFNEAYMNYQTRQND